MVRKPAAFVPATERQISFIVTLATERGYAYEAEGPALIAPDSSRLNLAEISKSAASPLINSLKATPKREVSTVIAPSPSQLATERQVEYLGSLMNSRGWDVEGTNATSPQGEHLNLVGMSRSDASKLIDELRNTAATRSRPRKADPNAKITEDGMYCLDGVIYKVQYAVHGSGFLYAKRLVVDELPERDEAGKLVRPAEMHFERDSSAMAKLLPEHRLTVEAAKAFGALYGICVRCAATLTKEESIERGMGDICSGKI